MRKLLVAPSQFINVHVRHRCIAGLNGNGCEQVMVVPDPNTPGAPAVLTEGQMWSCGNCGAVHEYYIAWVEGNKTGMVRLLEGVDERDSGEPRVTEFLEEPKISRCEHCFGTGKIRAKVPGRSTIQETDCPKCQGRAFIMEAS